MFYPGSCSSGDGYLLLAELFYYALFARMVDCKRQNENKYDDSCCGQPDGNPHIGPKRLEAIVVNACLVHDFLKFQTIVSYLLSFFFLSSYHLTAKIT